MAETMKPIRATPTPPTDKIIADVKAAKASDLAKGTGPKVPYKSPASTATPVMPDLHSALHAVGSELLAAGHEPASMASIGFAFRDVASRMKPQAPDIGTGVEPKPVRAPEIGEDKSGLFGTPSPEKEAT
jgi:hypothetical protein